MRGLKIRTVQILIAGHRHKDYRPYQRDEIARRLLSYRQKTQTPHPLLGKESFPVTIR